MSHWCNSLLKLPFRVGPISLFSVRFHGVEPKAYFMDWPKYPESESEILAGANDQAVVVLRSQPLSGPVSRLRWADGRIWYVPNVYEHRLVDLTTPFSAYLARLSSKTRSTIQRKVRKFHDHFREGAGFEVFRSEEELYRFYVRAREVSKVTYQERLMGTGLPVGRAFIDEMCLLGRSGSARAFLLSAQGRDIAYLYSPGHDGVLRYSYLGYVPEFANWSPGTVLQYLALESIFQEGGFLWYDFEEGDGQHKDSFATNSISCCDLFVFRGSLKSSVVTAAHWALLSSVRAASLALRRFGLIQKLKRIIRRQ